MKASLVSQFFKQYELIKEIERFYYKLFLLKNRSYNVKLEVRFFEKGGEIERRETVNWDLCNIGGKLVNKSFFG